MRFTRIRSTEMTAWELMKEILVKTIAPLMVICCSFGVAFAGQSRDDFSLVFGAESGNSEAQYVLGGKYFSEGDIGGALHWWRKDAENRQPDAEVLLGNIYEFGENVPQDYQEALKWYRQAVSEHNSLPAEDALGRMYQYGHGVSQDYA
jgi:tetratricopeptide (TPR) repeat protein